MIEVPLTYSQLFDTDQFYQSLDIQTLPSEVSILMMSMINHQLFAFKKHNRDIFYSILDAWNVDIRLSWINALHSADHKYGRTLTIFNEWLVTEFIKYELVNYTPKDPEDNRSSERLEFLVIIKYLKFTEDLINRKEHKRVVLSPAGQVDYLKTSYQSHIKQYHFSGGSNLLYEVIQAYCFLKIIKELEPEYYSNYSDLYKIPDPWKLATAIAPIVRDHTFNDTLQRSIPIIEIEKNSEYERIFLNKILDIDEYEANESLKKRFIGIESKPLLKLEGNEYCVMSWRFLQQSIGTNLIFDFYKRSGINSKYHTLPLFKSHVVSLHITERTLFRTIMKVLYEKRYVSVFFDDDSALGLPDCYIRERNTIYLIEFKDLLFNNSIIESSTYDEFKQYIRSKLIENHKGKPRGIGQIISQIRHLNTKNYLFDKFSEKGFRRRSISIYPIIVYTDKHYSFPGVNQYITDYLINHCPETSFKLIHEPTLISLSYIFERLVMFKEKRLDKIIKDYHRKINKSRNKIQNKSYNNYNEGLENLEGMYASVELTPLFYDEESESKKLKRREILSEINREINIKD